MEEAECSIALELSLLRARNRKRGKSQESCSELERQLDQEVKIARKCSKKATPQPCSTASSGKEYRYGNKGIEKAPTTRPRPQKVATMSGATMVTTTMGNHKKGYTLAYSYYMNVPPLIFFKYFVTSRWSWNGWCRPAAEWRYTMCTSNWHCGWLFSRRRY